ncbi:hypothetical protein DM02DRAFT_495001, partial [Periconia macrospinosa]
ASSPYQERLPPNSIRLLRICTTPTGNLTGTLRVFPLTQAPRFYTASYTWGEKVYTSTITTTDPPGSLKVLRNLLPFLRMVTTHRDFHDEQWWWIDSLCINQDDTEERGAQVDLMTDIYKASSSVIVWLGETVEGDSDCTLAIELLHRLSTLVLNNPRNEREKQRQQIRHNRLWHPDLRPQWTSLSHLLARKWWSRVWTLQEFVIPQRARLCCGPQSINRRTFKRAFYNIYLVGISRTTAAGEGNGVVEHDLIPRAIFDAPFNRRRVQQLDDDDATDREMSLVAMLAYMGNAEASDARDRVFSVRGLIAETDRKMLGKPEYTTDVSMLFRRLVVRFWRTYHSLDIICFAHIFTKCAATTSAGDDDDDGNQKPLPSWTPDWRIPIPFISPVPLMASQSGNPHIGNFRPLHASTWTTSYDASGPRLRKEALQKVTFDADLTELRCWGVVLSTIEELGSLEGCGTRCRSFVCEAEEGAHGMLSSAAALCEDEIVGEEEEDEDEEEEEEEAIEIIQALARCLTLDRKDKYFCHKAPAHYAAEFLARCRQSYSSSGNPPPSSSSTTTTRVDDTFATWFEKNRTLRLPLGKKKKNKKSGKMTTTTLESLIISASSIATTTTEQTQTQTQTETETETETERFLSRFHDTIVKKSRRVFIGARRRRTSSVLLGMAPCRARIGDAVVVLGGCSVPLVLRRKEEDEKKEQEEEEEEEKWEVIGEAYIDGFMEGEV